ncbi:MAG: helix-turn-helix domain-containing protein [Bacteroidota bacterium]
MVVLKNISDLSALFQQEKPRHPLITVIDFTVTDEKKLAGSSISAGFYSVMFKNYCSNQLKYGREYYDFQEGSLLCVAPGQVITLDSEFDYQKKKEGWGVFFHPDLLRGSSLQQINRQYRFFSYATNEALHLSDKEKSNLRDCVARLRSEIAENTDNHSQTLIVSNLELLLNYCRRYYDRQFITRKSANSSLLAQFESELDTWFRSGEKSGAGLPSVKSLAEKLHVSPNYLSDLLKKETGMNTQDHIHAYLIEEAKNLLVGTDLSVRAMAYTLGFEYPQYFSRLFKSKTGMTPSEFRGRV